MIGIYNFTSIISHVIVNLHIHTAEGGLVLATKQGAKGG